jgi:hypothetical protein
VRQGRKHAAARSVNFCVTFVALPVYSAPPGMIILRMAPAAHARGSRNPSWFVAARGNTPIAPRLYAPSFQGRARQVLNRSKTDLSGMVNKPVGFNPGACPSPRTGLARERRSPETWGGVLLLRKPMSENACGWEGAHAAGEGNHNAIARDRSDYFFLATSFWIPSAIPSRLTPLGEGRQPYCAAAPKSIAACRLGHDI